MARVEVLVDAFPGKKSFKDLGSSVDKVAENFLKEQPPGSRLLSATQLPRAGLFTTPLYEFRFAAAGGELRIQKCALTQSRFYKLLVILPADAPEPLQLEVEEIIDSFKAFPLNIGCLAQSNQGTILPGVCY